MSGFKYFVILGGMRTGSNFLEATLNEFPDIECHGELFNPAFVGHHGKESFRGISISDREKDPLQLLNKMIEEGDGLQGFRFFSEHDQRIFAHILNDADCAKVILTRNPVESFVSWKIANQTDQWRLGDAKQRREAKISFNMEEFEKRLGVSDRFYADIRQALQTSGQSAFDIDYRELGNRKIINGLASWIGTNNQIKALSKQTKKQNPAALSEKVVNYDEMRTALSGLDPFRLAEVPNFEPERGPGVPGFFAGTNTPILFVPAFSGIDDAVIAWMKAQNGSEDLLTGFNQKDLRNWKKDHPGHRTISIVSHPFKRAARVFFELALTSDEDPQAAARKLINRRYGVSFPRSNASTADFVEGFRSFLGFLKSNLNGQTSLNTEPRWATQYSLISAASTVLPIDRLIREADLQEELNAVSAVFGRSEQKVHFGERTGLPTIKDLIDPKVLADCHAAYRRDFVQLGFNKEPDA